MKFAKIKQKVGIGTLQLEEKINEEIGEFEEALKYKDIEEQLAEGFDVMQAVYSMLLVRVNYDVEKLEKANIKHLEKLRGRGHEFIE